MCVCSLFHYVNEHRHQSRSTFDDAKLRIKKTSQMVWNVLGTIWERIGKIKVWEGKLFRVLRPV